MRLEPVVAAEIHAVKRAVALRLCNTAIEFLDGGRGDLRLRCLLFLLLLLCGQALLERGDRLLHRLDLLTELIGLALLDRSGGSRRGGVGLRGRFCYRLLRRDKLSGDHKDCKYECYESAHFFSLRSGWLAESSPDT